MTMKELTAILILIVTAALMSGCIDIDQSETNNTESVDLSREELLLQNGINPETGELIPMTLEEISQ